MKLELTAIGTPVPEERPEDRVGLKLDSFGVSNKNLLRF
jgi:hypothetical protein